MKFQEALEPVLSAKLGAPRIQLISFLQCNTIQLDELLREAALDNPFLSWDINESLVNQKNFYRYHSLHTSSEDSDSYDPFQTVAAQQSLDLYDHLFIQLSVSKAAPSVKKAAARLIPFLDTGGRLITELSVIAAAFGIFVDDLGQALQLIQSFEPAGVGARSLSECLRLQLARMDNDDLYAEEIVQNYLEDLAQKRYAYIAEKLRISEQQVQESCELIRSLNPRPCAAFKRNEPVAYVVPDAWAEYRDGIWNVHLCDNALDHLRYSSSLPYDHLSLDPQAATWLSEKRREARELVLSIQKRQETIISLLQFLLDYQTDNALDPTKPLRPLLLSDLSRITGLHLSTVSRIMSGKYVALDYGTRPLQSFLSKRHAASGQSTDEICVAITKLIAAENPAHPLSDAALCSKLEEAGVSVARRTIAKYREHLGIPSSSVRKNGKNRK